MNATLAILDKWIREMEARSANRSGDPEGSALAYFDDQQADTLRAIRAEIVALPPTPTEDRADAK